MIITGLLGYPLVHSFSAQLFNTCYQKLGLDYLYLPFEVVPPDFKTAFNGLKVLGVKGVNVTVPYKEKVISCLDKLDESAELIGAVNAINFTEKLATGYNTDGEGFLRALREEAKLRELKAFSVLLLGAGGGARAAAFALLSAGVKKLFIFNRHLKRAQNLAKALAEKFPAAKIFSAPLHEPKALEKALLEVNLLVNATTVGMFPEVEISPLTFPDESLAGLWVFDLVYNPLKTRFLQEAEQRGAKTINGLLMLIYQAALAFELWTGKNAPLPLMKWVAWEAGQDGTLFAAKGGTT